MTTLVTVSVNERIGEIAVMRAIDVHRWRVVAQIMAEATAMMAVPTFYTRLLQHPGLNPALVKHVRLFTSGSAPLLAETHREWSEKTGHSILERYGMTETSPVSFQSSRDDPLELRVPLPWRVRLLVQVMEVLAGPQALRVADLEIPAPHVERDRVSRVGLELERVGTRSSRGYARRKDPC